MKQVLVTGGAGYIGTHTLIQLVEAGYKPIVVDNYYNSCKEAIHRVEKIVKTDIILHEVDVTDEHKMEEIFKSYDIDSIIHFAGYKAVGESVQKPEMYYENNLLSTLVLLKCMQKYGVKKFVFSSSATVYGDPHTVPITEDFPTSTTNPYGSTKLMNEHILEDVGYIHKDYGIMLLRYFNPIGAYPTGTIGEDPKGIPNNLMPYILQVAVGRLEKLHVFGDDYNTPDGTGVRDYIHVVDLAKGHVAALNYLDHHTGVEKVNLGTGKGYSVLDIVHTFSNVNKIDIPYVIGPRRAGDIATNYADSKKAKELLNWEASLNLEDMCRDAWNWQKNNPNGYEK